MGHFEFEYLAKGVSRETLFPWYFDYSSDDVEIIRRRGDGSLVKRKVMREGNKVTVQNEHMIRGRPTKVTYQTVIHPEDFSCDVRIMSQKGESNRHYSFADTPAGTKITFTDNYRVRGAILRLADMLGFVRGRLAKASEMAMKAYVAEAEEILSKGG